MAGTSVHPVARYAAAIMAVPPVRRGGRCRLAVFGSQPLHAPTPMDSSKPFYGRRRDSFVGRIFVPVHVTNVLEPSRAIGFDGLVDTGAFGLVLPMAWKERLGPLPDVATVEVETADQRVVMAEIRGPVRIQVDGFRRIVGEAVFIDMEPRDGSYEPLVGYTVLELGGIAIDLVSHRLVARKFYDAKSLRRPGPRT
jgi:predicted aspartyl protease